MEQGTVGLRDAGGAAQGDVGRAGAGAALCSLHYTAGPRRMPKGEWATSKPRRRAEHRRSGGCRAGPPEELRRATLEEGRMPKGAGQQGLPEDDHGMPEDDGTTREEQGLAEDDREMPEDDEMTREEQKLPEDDCGMQEDSGMPKGTTGCWTMTWEEQGLRRTTVGHQRTTECRRGPQDAER